MGAGGHFEHLRHEVLRAAIAGRPVAHGFRPGFRHRHQIRNGSHRRIGVDHDHQGHDADQPDRGEIPGGVVVQLPVEPRVDGQRRAGGHQQRVAVGRRAGHQRSTHAAAGARLVLDDDRAAEQGRHLAGQQAAEDVGRAAGCVGHDDGDGTLRLSQQRERQGCRRGQACRACQELSAHHGVAFRGGCGRAMRGLTRAPSRGRSRAGRDPGPCAASCWGPEG